MREVWDFIKGCDIVTESSKQFFMLYKEMDKMFIDYDFSGVNVLNIISVEDVISPRNVHTLSKSYDVPDTILDVIGAQLDSCGMSIATLEESLSPGFKRVDCAGYLKMDASGVILWAKGRNKNRPVIDDLPYAQYMLKSDINHETRKALENIFKR